MRTGALHEEQKGKQELMCAGWNPPSPEGWMGEGVKLHSAESGGYRRWYFNFWLPHHPHPF